MLGNLTGSILYFSEDAGDILIRMAFGAESVDINFRCVLALGRWLPLVAPNSFPATGL
jgi:hypothetical protein